MNKSQSQSNHADLDDLHIAVIEHLTGEKLQTKREANDAWLVLVPLLGFLAVLLLSGASVA